MGACAECGKTPRTELEDQISLLIGSLRISKTSTKEYVNSIKTAMSKDNNLSDLKPKFKEFIRPTEINNRICSEDFQHYVEKLREDEYIIFAFALLLLTKPTIDFSLERNYYQMKEIFKRRIAIHNDFELLNIIVRSYGKLIKYFFYFIY